MPFPFSLSTGVPTPTATDNADIRERDPELHYEAEYDDTNGLQDDAPATPARSGGGWPLRLLSAGVSLPQDDRAPHPLPAGQRARAQ
jgi:hypothetical protein